MNQGWSKHRPAVQVRSVKRKRMRVRDFGRARLPLSFAIRKMKQRERQRQPKRKSITLKFENGFDVRTLLDQTPYGVWKVRSNVGDGKDRIRKFQEQT